MPLYFTYRPPNPSAMASAVSHPMLLALAAGRRSIARGQSPFAAVILRGPEVIADTHNHVRANTDSTAHAEVMAIRDACRALNSIDLSGCEMYTTCEPCPMCAAAIHWAKLDAVHYGATIDDAARAGFNELHVSIDHLYKEGGSTVRIHRDVMRRECAALFDEWLAAGGRPY
jgi:guanine deaminase